MLAVLRLDDRLADLTQGLLDRDAGLLLAQHESTYSPRLPSNKLVAELLAGDAE